MGSYFGWLAAFDVYYSFVDDWRPDFFWHVIREVVGLPTFLLGCTFLAGVVRSSTPVDEGVVHRAQSEAARAARPGVGTQPPA
jgi:hypothetical protein